MRILLLGGSGHVGSLVLPYLTPDHFVRVLDLNAPKKACGEYIEGSVLDFATVATATDGMDGVIYSALAFSRETGVIRPFYDLSVTAVDVCLDAADRAGIRHAVYLSSISIYNSDGRDGFLGSEDRPADSPTTYGLVKSLGEQVARHFADHRGMITTVLRLDNPCSVVAWQKKADKSGYTTAIAAPDLADAMVRALERTEPGYQVCFTTGDWEQGHHCLERAKRILGWEPKTRPGAEGPLD